VNIGDLVTVHPSASSIYVVVGEEYQRGNDHTMGRLWLLYNEEIGIQAMYEKWIQVIDNE